MKVIHGGDLEKALECAHRVYLCGDLQKPQQFPCIYDSHNEVGTSYYKNFTADQPHFHTTATEYNYVICGSSKVLLVDDGKEYLLKAGSLFVIPPMTKYASKHLANTKILFFKSPGGNDKCIIEVSDALNDWLYSW